jgi:nucleoside 2-deoxyribosyltransferase
MVKQKKMVYVAGALHTAPNIGEAYKLYEFIAKIAKESGFSAFVPHLENMEKNKNHCDTSNIFLNDYHGLMKSDVVVACIGYSSTGTGAELAFSLRDKRKIIAIFKMDESPTPYITQAIKAFEKDKHQILVFKDRRHLGRILREALKKI